MSSLVETHEEKEAREAQARAAAATATSQNKPEENDIWEAIKGFLKFFFEIFFPSNNAPHEEEAPGTPPETLGDRLRLGKLIIDAKAMPKWEQYMREHGSEKVEFQSPVVGASQVTSSFGHRHAPKKGASTDHAGVDLGARGSDGTPDIVASAAGIVLFAGRKQGYGNTVMIGHADGTYTLYAHMSGEKMPAIGAHVKQGEQIGVMGATGTATATHLHYEQRKGSEAMQPKIGGVLLTEGMKIASAQSPQDTKFAALVNPKAHANLPVQDGGKPVALAFASATTSISGGRLL